MTDPAVKQSPGLVYLGNDAIRHISISMREIIDVVEEAFRQHGTGAAEMGQRAGIYPRPESFTQALLAHIPTLSAAGAKIVSVFPPNRGTDVPVTTALLVLTDPATGAPLSVLDATWITAARTGAVTAVAAKYLAPNDTRELAIIGAGVQGRANLQALATAFPKLTEVRVYDIRREASEAFIEDLKSSVSLKINRVDSAQRAIEGADIIVTATAVFKERNPLVRREWIKPGVLIAPLEVDRALDVSLVYEPDLLVVDETSQALAFQKMGCFSEGLPTIHGQLGEIVAGKKEGRRRAIDIVVAMNVGLPIFDIAVGHLIYRHAVESNIGQRLA